MLKVLTDYHNGALYKSLHLLFEKRLGWEMYRPIGMDWFSNGYFKIAEPYGNAMDTVGQYLDINDKAWDSRKNLNGDYKLKDGIYHVWDTENKIHHKAITYEMFKEMQFDLVMATHPLHGNWRELSDHFIMQLGNENQDTDAKNVLSSVWAYQPKEWQNVLYYHQEFDLDEFYYEPPTNHNTINSYVWGCPEVEVFNIFRASLKDFEMNNTPSTDLANDMRKSAFGWHIKPADGYGHVLHNWYAVGRPVITRGSYYEGKTGGLLLEDGLTCIDIDKHSFDETVELIRYWSKPENHQKMCEQAYVRFKQVVDFDRELSNIREFISKVI